MADPGAVNRLLSDLETWRAEHPGHTPEDQQAAFSLSSLWSRAEGDATLYRRFMEIVGYIGRKGAL